MQQKKKNREKRQDRERKKDMENERSRREGTANSTVHTRSELLSGFTHPPPPLPHSQYRTHFHATLKSHTTLKSHAMS